MIGSFVPYFRFHGLPCGSDDKESASKVGDLGLILESSLEKGMATLENSIDRGAWWDTVFGTAESDMPEQLPFSL